MKDDVKKCIEMRTDFFEKYYTVPENMCSEVNGFIAEITTLGENCENAMEFEEKFSSKGLSEKFNSILSKSIPCPPKMTKAEKQHAKQVAKEMFKDNKGQILRDFATDIVDSIAVKAESDLIANNRKSMIEDGTFDEYTRTKNRLEDVENIGSFLFKKFRKK